MKEKVRIIIYQIIIQLFICKSINNHLEIHRMKTKVSFNTYLLILVYFVVLCLILSLSLSLSLLLLEF